jgi:hypothetical protein
MYAICATDRKGPVGSSRGLHQPLGADMTTDYASIRAENKRRYGTDIGRIGTMLLADRYDDRTHFIFELLQNAEDALSRSRGIPPKRNVNFELSEQTLRFSHFGVPFDEQDVRGICGIAESTKDDKAIGRFGIGFKSVYAFTDRPEIHSGPEHFTIESFVWPVEVEATQSAQGETVIVLPLRQDDPDAVGDILGGLQRLGARTLLFLREIDEITWSSQGGFSGVYLRDKPKHWDDNVRKVTLIGEDRSTTGVTEESWLIFSRSLDNLHGGSLGEVEIAFALQEEEDGEQCIRPISDSNLVVYFPTIVATNLGFLLQGPYKTTPSRDNIQRRDSWNQQLLRESASLLVEALRTLRELDLLDTNALQTLPLEQPTSTESISAPFFEAVRSALMAEPLLPRFPHGHSPANKAMLARTRGVRELFSPEQLGYLYGNGDEMHWLSESITQDRTPVLRTYLMQQLDIDELDPGSLVSRLTKEFLETQSDEWIIRLYRLLLGQPGFFRNIRLKGIPIVRLEDGSHTVPFEDGEPKAYLPGDEPSGFPTAKRTICSDESARELLEELGMAEPDLVDDVIVNTLPRYEFEVEEEFPTTLRDDVHRILRAFETDSTSQQRRLEEALATTCFVPAIDAGNGTKKLVQPSDVYLATERLKELFEGVRGVLLVDDSYEFMRGEGMRSLLESCGSTRYLKPIEVPHSFSDEELERMREEAGESRWTMIIHVRDYTLRGLDELFSNLHAVSSSEAAAKAGLLWEALHELLDRRGQSVFSGEYRWFYRTDRRRMFEARWVKDLNNRTWVPDSDGILRKPSSVIFESIDPPWEDQPFLRSQIEFKPHILDSLATEMGLEPGVLTLLKELGLTTVTELRSRLGVDEKHVDDEYSGDIDLQDEFFVQESQISKVYDPGVETEETTTDGFAEPSRPTEEISGREQKKVEGARSIVRQGTETGFESACKSRDTGASTPPHRTRPIEFVSYVAVHPDETDTNSDGLSNSERMKLEDQSINLILKEEPDLERTAASNAGFDLCERGSSGEIHRWIEVKAMTGTLDDRPVTLSRKQFEYAGKLQEAFWLYIVERASDPKHARILRIQNPAGSARWFTFDRGWRNAERIFDPK